MKLREFSTCITATVFLGCFSSASHAATITQSGSFGPTASNFSTVAQGFNTALGTLNSVSFTMTGTAQAILELVNFSSTPVNFTQGSTQTLMEFSNLQASAPPPVSISVSGVSGTAAGETTTGVPQISLFDGSASAFSDNYTVNAGDLSAFEGTGPVTLASGNIANFNSAATYDSSSVFVGGEGAISGNWTVTYNYTATPEPTTLAMWVGFGTTGIGFLVRKRRMTRSV